MIERPAVIRQILDHLSLAITAANLRTLPDQPDGGAAEQSRERAYELLFDDLPIPDPVLVSLGLKGRSVPPASRSIPIPQDST